MKYFTLITLFLSLITLTNWAQCNFDYTYSIDTANNSITFINTSTTSTSGTIDMYPDAVNGNPFSYTIYSNFITGSTTTTPYNDGDSYVDVCMYAFNANANCSDTICKTIYLPNPCGFTLNLNIVDNMDGSVTYTNTNSNNILFETGLISTQENSYNISAGQSITHTYGSIGTFPYLITVDDSTSTLNCYDTNYREITITNICSVDASFNYYSTNNNLNYDFYAIDSTNNCNYYWDFGDGTNSSLSNVNHTYTAAGIYTICLSISNCDSTSCADSVCQTITIGNNTNLCNISANYNWYQVYDSTNNTWTNNIYIINQSTGNNLSYQWSFGDGYYDYTQNPTHTYTNSTSSFYYYLCLNLTAPDSCYDSYCDSIIPEGNFSNYNIITLNGYTQIEENNSSTIELGKFYPNPTANTSFISISTPLNSYITISIIDLSGKIISQEFKSLTVGKNTIKLNTQSLSNGMYLVSIIDEKGFNTNLRLIKK